MSEAKKKKKSARKRQSVLQGCAYVNASYNNTLVSITDENGDLLAASSAGANGFKGAKKSTPYAASVTAAKAVEKAKVYGLEKVYVYVKGIGSGREQAIRGLQANGLNVIGIRDVTPVPHNGCRSKKPRRV